MRIGHASLFMLIVAGNLFASGQELVVSEKDFEEERIYSPFVGR